MNDENKANFSFKHRTKKCIECYIQALRNCYTQALYIIYRYCLYV